MIEPMTRPNHAILYVDDQESCLDLFDLAFGEEFHVRTAGSAAQALAILEREPVAVLVTDQRMPGMSGISLAETVRSRFPFVIRLIISAHVDSQELIDAINRGAAYRFVRKPWRVEEMREVLRSAVDVYHYEGLVNDLRLQQLRSDRLSSLGFACAGIAHDMRTPLTSLSAGMELIERRLSKHLDEPEEVREDLIRILETCKQSVWRLRSLVASIRTHIKEQPDITTRVDLGQVVESTLRLCRNEVLARAQLTLEKEAAPVVVGDPSQLGQVILNLVNNAVLSIPLGAMERNRVEVTVRQDDAAALVQVSDTGEGIDPEAQKRIFDPFYSTRAEGTGLGLAIVREIVTRHGGELHLESEVGKGSTFTVRLPLA
jgi:signal transduction histidine kinase